MSVIPGSIEPDRQPPLTIPLRHFLIGLLVLLGGAVLGLAIITDVVPGRGSLAHLHLVLAGWICITIMGAMTQFVPVWSGTSLYSRRLAGVQLVLVVVGLVGFVIALFGGALAWLPPFGVLMLAGFWTFVYNIARTMAPLESYDVTERHFALALGFFVLLTVLGVLLAIDFTWPLFETLPFTRSAVIGTHATTAVFGAVLTTVYGALYQLGTMFTQTELRGIERHLRSLETVGHPVGVVLLGLGRLFAVDLLARIGGLLVVGATLAIALILTRKLHEMQVDWTPMHTRYAVAGSAFICWALSTIPTWLDEPTSRAALLGAPGTGHLLVLGAIGFVVLGTLYHIVPFLIWVHRYSARLGLEDVPMVDDIYDDRLAMADATLLVGGTLVLVISSGFRRPMSLLALGGGLVTLGIVVFATNLLLVVRAHSPRPLIRILLGSLDPRRSRVSAVDTELGEQR